MKTKLAEPIKKTIVDIIKEEIQLFEQNKIYSLQDLSQLMGNMGVDANIALKMLSDKFRKEGDEGVMKMFKEMSGVEVFQASRGKYSFAPMMSPEYNN
jgi:hypothetical protein